MKAVLFDMDGVLVDVSASYRATIQQVVEDFSGQPISLERIRDYKNRGGLNNDWDLCQFILADMGTPADRQDVVDRFQALYIGNNYNGLITREKWLLDKEKLVWIDRRFRIGIVTGRPKAEARFTLNFFDMASFFPVVVTMEDVPPDRGKPDPTGLIMALDGLSAREGYYVGDTVDDMLASCRAGLVGIGIASSSKEDKKQNELLLSKGASKVFPHVNHILEVLK